ncbi:hypothetical protein PV08_09512 [Exophiala spinifera]|uniref:Alpha/beta hydrolase fold-3 domain-containing protein n=1 Tax=Exophiala spinifera TaxID=91928 RepID=A0A0D1YBD1_9EURO|nr:uncharacterized protein PV08_09512 [Exophiala spinifera]KIW12236.1 hypothetical protein PV08_09512 [Exophiala spinifera]
MSYQDRLSVLATAKVDPELHEFLAKANLPAPNFSDIVAFKQNSLQRNEASRKVLGLPPAGVKQTELQYITEDGSKLRAKLYQPATQPSSGSPLIVLFHGGGFCTGEPEGEEQTARNFVLAFGATCISAAYRLAPEFQFPHAPKDAWDALRWAAANAKSWGADTSAGFVVGGTSSGANLAAVVAHLARDEKLFPPLTGQYLAVPTLLPPSKVPDKYKDWFLSFEQNRKAPVLPVAALDMFMSAYAPNDDDGVLYASFNHPRGHQDLPRTLFQIDGMDPLRDDSLIYERVLREEYSIQTKFYLYPGLPHAHWAFFPFLKGSEKFRREQIEGMGWLLGRNPDYAQAQTTPIAAVA